MMMIILILTSLWWSSWSSPAWSPLSSSWFRCYMSTGQTAGLLWVWRWSLIFPSVEALREPALNTLVLFPPNNLCNFVVSSVFFVVHDFGLKEKFLERQIFLIRILLIWQNPIVSLCLSFPCSLLATRPSSSRSEAPLFRWLFIFVSVSSFLVRRLWLILKLEKSLQMPTSGKEAGSLDSNKYLVDEIIL